MLTFLRRLISVFAPLGLLCGCVAAGDAVVAPTSKIGDAGMSRAQAEAVYLERFEAQQKAALAGGGISSYDPLAEVRGAERDMLLTDSAPRINDTALAAAREYAAARNSSSLVIYHAGKISSEQYYGDVGPSSLINSKSLAKPISAIVVGRAIAQGHIKSLDQPVADYFAEWRDDPGKSKIKVRHLLDMRSGLLAQSWGGGPESVLNRAYLHPFHDQVIVEEYPLVNQPGSRYEYANANSELVALLIARATGRKYHEYMADELLIPMGAKGGTVWMNRKGGTPHAGCCIQLPARTYLKFALLLMNDGMVGDARLLPEGYVAQMRTATAENPHAGLGVWIAGPYVKMRGPLHPEMEMGRTLHSEPYLDRDIFLFDGNGNQVIYIVPSQQLVILRTGSWPRDGAVWDNSYLPNLIISNIKRAPGETMPEPQPGE